MKSSVANTLDFSVAEEQRSALESPEHKAARAEFGGLASDNSYRPWNHHFVDPTAPLDLPLK